MIQRFLSRYLLLFLIGLSLLAFFWDIFFRAIPDPFLVSREYLEYLFCLTMLAVGSLLPRDEITQIRRQWGMVFVGTALQYSAMPLLAYWIGRAFGFEGKMMVGVMIVGVVPGAMASNVLTLIARGHVSYSVSLTTTATLLSPLVVPALLYLGLRHWVPVPLGETAWTLTWTVVIPVIVGYCLSQSWPLWRRLAQHIAPIVAHLSILWIIAVVVAANRHRLETMDGLLPLALVTINLGGYATGFLGALLLKLPNKMQRALTLEIGMQNAGLGAILASRLFGVESEAAMAPTIYAFACMFTGTVLARIWAEIPTATETVPNGPPAEAAQAILSSAPPGVGAVSVLPSNPGDQGPAFWESEQRPQSGLEPQS